MNVATRRSTILVSVAAALALSGCTFGTAPAPTPSAEAVASSTPTPTPEPVDPLTTVSAIVVRPEHLDLLDAAGAVVATLSYDAESAEFIATLSTVLGAEPAVSEHGASMETPPRTEYDWDGVQVSDDHEDDVPAESGANYGEVDMNVSVHFKAPTVGDGVAVRTVNGFQPGGDAQALAAELGEPWYDNGFDHVRVETGEPIGEQQSYTEYENAYSVAVNTWEWEGASNTVFAPWNFGIGHV